MTKQRAFAAAMAPIEEIVDEASNGRMFVLVDDGRCEDEGHLVIPAQFATPDTINFMAKFGRGLICLALTKQRVEVLELPALSCRNAPPQQTAFTVSIEARVGVSTGISAADRAATIQVAIDGAKGPGDLVSPGHVFPLCAREGGVLVRRGHAEAAVDIATLAGLNPSGVVCAIMNDEGAMARLDQLVHYAMVHGLKIGTISDLIAYRRRHEVQIEPILQERFSSNHGGEWKLRVYRDKLGRSEHLALIKGEIAPGAPTLVRMHVFSMYDDILHEAGGRTNLIPLALDVIGEQGAGVLVLIRNFGSINFTEMLESDRKEAALLADQSLREYGVCAEILLDLGISQIELLTDARQASFTGLDGYGLEITARRPLPRPQADEVDREAA